MKPITSIMKSILNRKDNDSIMLPNRRMEIITTKNGRHVGRILGFNRSTNEWQQLHYCPESFPTRHLAIEYMNSHYPEYPRISDDI